MIRINLLPQKRRRVERTSQTSQLWLVAILVVALLEAGGLLIFHGIKRDQLAQQVRRNRTVEEETAAIRAKVQNHEEIKKQLEALRAREDAIAKLQSARTGPTAVLLELGRLLTPDRGPSVEPATLQKMMKAEQLSAYNPGWDPRRLWLTSFVEDTRLVRLKGVARDAEDVSELARRMAASYYFQDVKLLPARREREAVSGLELVSFELEAKVKY